MALYFFCERRSFPALPTKTHAEYIAMLLENLNDSVLDDGTDAD
jgi:hypothetical protein